MSACRDTNYVRNSIKQRLYTSAVDVTRDFITPSSTTREYLEKTLSICSDRRAFRLIRVEEINEHSVFICVPDGKMSVIT